MLGKSALVKHLAEASGVAAKDVKAVLAAVEGAISGAISKKGAGSFTLPGLFKVTAVKVPAKAKRKGINPFTKDEQRENGKPVAHGIPPSASGPANETGRHRCRPVGKPGSSRLVRPRRP